MDARKARKTRAYKKARAIVIARPETRCCRCGHYVDKTLSGRHPDGPSADHLDPLALGGDVYDAERMALAHLRCNSSHGGKLGVHLRRVRAMGVAEQATHTQSLTSGASEEW